MLCLLPLSFPRGGALDASILVRSCIYPQKKNMDIRHYIPLYPPPPPPLLTERGNTLPYTQLCFVNILLIYVASGFVCLA